MWKPSSEVTRYTGAAVTERITHSGNSVGIGSGRAWFYASTRTSTRVLDLGNTHFETESFDSKPAQAGSVAAISLAPEPAFERR